MKPIPFCLITLLAGTPWGFAAAAEQPASAHGWQQSQNTDTARAMTFTRFTLVGQFTTSPQTVVPNRPALIVDCIPSKESGSSKGRFLAASLHVGSPLKIKYVEPEEIHGTSYFPKVEVRYRTDDDKEEREKWSPLSEKEKTAASIPKDAMKKILRARSVAITTEDEGGSSVAMQFAMPNPADIEASCNVD